MNDYKSITKLEIFKNNIFCATLERTELGCKLIFDNEFIENNEIPYFSYCIPKNKSPIIIQGDNLPPFFAGLLPEGRRFNALINKIKTSSDDLFSVLAAVGKDCIGDISITTQFYPENINPPNIKQTNFYDYFEKLIDPTEQRIDNHALAGVQEKISASMISFPLNIANTDKSYILKLNPQNKNNLIQNEYICLQLAHKCGLKTNKAKIIKDKDDNPGLLVERFDNYNQIKLHQEDACQFLDLYPANKYRVTMNQIADAMMQITQAPQIEIMNLLYQYIFSYLICNGDLHAKNISLQTLQDGTITLTPAYDLICTAIYDDLSMAIKIEGKDNNIKRKTILNFAERYHISNKAMNLLIDKILLRFNKYYPILFTINMEEKKQNLLKNMILKRIQDLK